MDEGLEKWFEGRVQRIGTSLVFNGIDQYGEAHKPELEADGVIAFGNMSDLQDLILAVVRQREFDAAKVMFVPLTTMLGEAFINPNEVVMLERTDEVASQSQWCKVHIKDGVPVMIKAPMRAVARMLGIQVLPS